jgi:hypothetical protein
MNMNEQTKRIVVNRIISHLNPVPAGAANELLQQPLADLERILTKLADTREQENVEEEALARIQEAQTERAFDTAWGATLARVSLNGKRLCDVESNKQMFESLLQPHEKPSEAIYKTLALQFASKFSWETPQPKRLLRIARLNSFGCVTRIYSASAMRTDRCIRVVSHWRTGQELQDLNARHSKRKPLRLARSS